MSRLLSIGAFIFNKLLSKKEVVVDVDFPELDEVPSGPFPTPKQLKNHLFLYTRLVDIETYWPILYNALKVEGLEDKQFLCYALATLYVENDKFKPLAETPSKYSTKSGTKPYDFSNYVGKGGNKTLEEASLYRGSGFIQLTLKENYAYFDKKLDLDGGLLEQGYVAANEPHIAAHIFAVFLKDREAKIRAALDVSDFRKARTYVNGKAALHWEKLEVAYRKLESLF